MGGKLHPGNTGGSNTGVRQPGVVVSRHHNMNSGSGESTRMQPQAIYGFSLLQGLRGNLMEDTHVAEFRDVDGEEVL
jgi:hypothetical protein